MSSDNRVNPTGGFVAWQSAVLRAFHPVRWFVCILGAALTLAACKAALDYFEQRNLSLEFWWQNPIDGLTRLGHELVSHGWVVGLFRGFVLGVPLYAMWGILAGWLTRWELLALQRQFRPDRAILVEANLNAVTGFVLQRLSRFVFVVLLVAVVAAGVSVPGILAGLITRLVPGGFGALFVSLFLPLVLMSSLVLVLVCSAAFCYWLMPAVIACEGSDSWEAVSRGYSYFFNAPLSFLWREALVLAIAALPLVGVVYLRREDGLFPGDLTAMPLIIALGLSFSIFWGLQAVVYLEMRRIIDETAEDDLYLEGGPESVPAVQQSSQASSPPTPTSRGRARVSPSLLILGGACLSWVVACDFITYWGGTHGRWVRWGLDGKWKPDAEGLYMLASWVAAFWGVIYFGIVLVQLWRMSTRQTQAR